ncbi:hypothetical protein Phou_098590 [Phytohabitans houttuyneae]|uniref:Guanylate cyclase domain-containing protein n=1 Tax=Phytohabitans houttuyneae TaxID=1076126 RepID=A0A6V8KTN6_9ACTN|nr:hypothetical protein Phou_098590 [Phytohabitans houttuyneae]
MLFVDLVGFTRRAGRLDPEDVRALQREYFSRVTRAVGRWQGVVEKYVGDAVLAVFGAPESDEYDAYRAVLAGLHVQRELAGLAWPDGTPVRARVGVGTGEVIVDLAAVRDGGQALVCGDIVNTAARVQVHAAPGTVVVTDATRGATGPWVRYAPLPAITPAGKPAPVDVWRAVAPVAPSAPDGSVPLVGRAAELSTVAARVTGALAERAPALVRVTGPAGVGKSRLAREALAATGARWWVGYGTPCGASYSPLADLVRRQARVEDATRPTDVRRRLRAWAGDLVPAGDLTSVLDGLFRLVAPPAEPKRPVAAVVAPLARLEGDGVAPGGPFAPLEGDRVACGAGLRVTRARLVVWAWWWVAWVPPLCPARRWTTGSRRVRRSWPRGGTRPLKVPCWRSFGRPRRTPRWRFSSTTCTWPTRRPGRSWPISPRASAPCRWRWSSPTAHRRDRPP